jgi:tRNA(Ile)-lysidine synthase
LSSAAGPLRVAVAYSGGRDSTALLHATLSAAARLGLEVVALHVHHGLSLHADGWLAHCRRRCERWVRDGRRLTFASTRLEGRPAAAESVEAWARRARYAALRAMAFEQGADLVLLGQHRRDQAETVLLQALRGAGPAGLAAMPRRVERGGIVWARPWLERPREAIEAYLKQHRLAFIDDESNADPRYDRNRLRLQVWPQLIAAFPQAESSLAEAALRSHEADAALAELAALDLAAVCGPQGLELERWLALSSARRGNALRAWIKAQTARAAVSSLVTRLLDELPKASLARWPCGAGELRVHRGRLTWQALVAPAGPAEPSLCVTRAGTYLLRGWGGALTATRVREGGVALSVLHEVTLVPRSGAERFQAGPARPPRSLKKQYQMAGVAPWQRVGPLVYSGGRLVFVPRLGIDARVLAAPGEPQVLLEWIVADAAGPPATSGRTTLHR